MSLSAAQIAAYRDAGHLTVPDVFDAARMDAAIADVMAWADETIEGLSDKDRQWYLDAGVKRGRALRKLDEPVYLRPLFRQLASDPLLVGDVEALIGPGVSVAFSQVFFKAPGGGGPKPLHQDNYYFGCDDPDGMVTAWIALDEATVENGCLYYADGSNKGPVLAHTAPEGQPFNLLVADSAAAGYAMTAAPVPRGGVSFHHGNTLHKSSDNLSPDWRRACAIHYVNRRTRFATPALRYDDARIVVIS